jgi:hypothetical protein
MYGGGKTIENDEMLYKSHKEVYAEKYGHFRNVLKKVMGNAWDIHFCRDVPNILIKTSLESLGIPCDYIQDKTDRGRETKSQTDGGVIYISNGTISIPLDWVEGKSSFSVTKGKGRGQASGLITEQYSRASSWMELVDNKIFPLIAFCYGTDYNHILGEYNIRRIREDLHTVGNCNPYEKGYRNSAWYYYKEKFTENEVKDIISTVLDENFTRLIGILESQKNKCIFNK